MTNVNDLVFELLNEADKADKSDSDKKSDDDSSAVDKAGSDLDDHADAGDNLDTGDDAASQDISSDDSDGQPPQDPTENSRKVYIFDDFLELLRIYKTTEKFVNNLIIKFTSETEVENSLKIVLDKIMFNIGKLSEFTENDLIEKLSIPQLTALLKHYIKDIQLIEDTIKTLIPKSMSAKDSKNK